MSIDAFILEPKNTESDLYTPIISRKFYDKCWVPAIDELNLHWLRGLAVGIDLTKEYLPNFLNEIYQLKEWSKGKLNESDNCYMIERITRLETMLEKAFQNEAVVVFIG